MTYEVYKPVTVQPRRVSSGLVPVGRKVVMAADAKPDSLGRLPVYVLDGPLYIEPKRLEPTGESHE